MEAHISKVEIKMGSNDESDDESNSDAEKNIKIISVTLAAIHIIILVKKSIKNDIKQIKYNTVKTGANKSLEVYLFGICLIITVVLFSAPFNICSMFIVKKVCSNLSLNFLFFFLV